MQKTILITGSTDGIGLETAKALYAQGHHILLHGRNPDKLANAQSKLALTLWSSRMAELHPDLIFVAVNPGSLLATKMVQEGFGMSGKDINIGTDILVRAALSDEFANASGKYFDNDSGQFADPHADALDAKKVEKVMLAIERVLAELTENK